MAMLELAARASAGNLFEMRAAIPMRTVPPMYARYQGWSQTGWATSQAGLASRLAGSSSKRNGNSPNKVSAAFIEAVSVRTAW